MTGPTRGSKFETEAATGPIIIQGDHGPVAYRNLRLSATVVHSVGSEGFPPVVPPKTYQRE